MDDTNIDSEEAREEIAPLGGFNSRRQHKKLRFSEETEQHQQQKPETPCSPKLATRASRFLSIYDASVALPSGNIRRLRQLYNQVTKDDNLSLSEEISDELLDKIPFKIEVISDRQDSYSSEQSPLAKRRNRNSKETMEIPKLMPSALTEERRLEIIEEILKGLNKENILDQTRRVHAIPFELPKTNQMQKNVAERIRDLTGSDIVMLNDHVYMKNLCKILDEQYKKTLEENFKRLELNGNRHQLLENIFKLNSIMK